MERLPGKRFKEQSLDTIEKELLMRQHAEEYGISLTDEEKQQAKEAAQHSQIRTVTM